MHLLEKKEDGSGPRCGHTLMAVAAIREDGTPNYTGPRLILFGGAIALEVDLELNQSWLASQMNCISLLVCIHSNQVPKSRKYFPESIANKAPLVDCLSGATAEFLLANQFITLLVFSKRWWRRWW